MQKGIKFLMFQDDPGEGMQAYLFKKFYWWNESCTEQIEKAFGIHIVYKSWKEDVYKRQGQDRDHCRAYIGVEHSSQGLPDSP